MRNVFSGKGNSTCARAWYATAARTAEPVKGQTVDWLVEQIFLIYRTTVRSWEFWLMLIGAQNYLQVESCLKMNFIIIRESHKFKWYWEIHIKKKISCSEAEQYALKLFRKYGYSSSMKSKFYQNNWKFQDEHSWEWDEYVIRERP